MAQRQRASPDPQPPLTPLSPTTSPRTAAGASAPHRTTSWPRCHQPTATWTPRSPPTLTTWTCSPWTGHNEREFQDAFVARLSHVLTGLGAGFAVGERQYQLPVGDQDYVLDLLFSHLGLRRYIIVELQVGRAEPAHLASSASPPSSTTCSADPEHGDQAPNWHPARRRPRRRRRDCALRGIDTPPAVSTYTNGPALPSHRTAHDTARSAAKTSPAGHHRRRTGRRPARRVWPTPVRVLPVRGRVDSTRDPTQVRTLPISGSTKTANSHRRSRMDRSMTCGYPTSYPPHPFAPEPA